MAQKPVPRKYTPEQMRKMDASAQDQIDKVNQNSLTRTKMKVERAQWEAKYRRGLI